MLKTTGDFFLYFLLQKFKKNGPWTAKEKCEKYINSKKPTKKTVCPLLMFLETTGNLILIILISKLDTKDMGKYVK